MCIFFDRVRGPRRSTRSDPLLPDAWVCRSLGDDNMVDEYDVGRPADVAQECGDANVAVARGRVTAWMIMDQQDSRRVQFERAPKNRAGIKCQLPNRAMLHLLVGDEPARRVQQQHAKNLDRKSTRLNSSH